MSGGRTKVRIPIHGGMNRIVVLDTGYPSYEYEQTLFRTHGYRFELYKGIPGDRNSQIEFTRDAAGILVRGTILDAEAIDQLKDLKAIVRYGTGYENIDLKSAYGRGIRVANVQGYASHAVSDHALGLMFACIRGIGIPWPEQFGKPVRPEVFELHDKTLGIIGIGRIGSHFSKKAAPMFQETLACDPYQNDEAITACGARKSGLDEVLARSHVISIHCTLTPETHHMIDRNALQQAHQKPVVINTARGGIIDSPALHEALESGRVHSAGLDVFETEPPGAEESALLAHPRVVATPHVAWYSDRASKELQRRAADNLLALLQGREVPDEIQSG